MVIEVCCNSRFLPPSQGAVTTGLLTGYLLIQKFIAGIYILLWWCFVTMSIIKRAMKIKFSWTELYFTSGGWLCVTITYLGKKWHQDTPWEVGKHWRSSVMLWTVLCWETVGPVIHVTLTCTNFQNITADQVKPFIAMVFSNASDVFQQDIPSCHNAKIV